MPYYKRIKQKYKKYQYLAKSNLNEKMLDLKQKYFASHPKLYEISRYEVEKLPYPTKWSQFYSYEKLVLEIGTGHGELLSYLSRRDSENLHIGFERIKLYTDKTHKKIKGASNAIVYKCDGYYYAQKIFEKNSLSQLYILFPDPWHKKKHHKRRPITKDWLNTIHSKLRKNGTIFFATDWEDYFNFVVDQSKDLITDQKFRIESGVYDPSAQGLPQTHYYKKWLSQGRSFQYIRLEKK